MMVHRCGLSQMWAYGAGTSLLFFDHVVHPCLRAFYFGPALREGLGNTFATRSVFAQVGNVIGDKQVDIVAGFRAIVPLVSLVAASVPKCGVWFPLVHMFFSDVDFHCALWPLQNGLRDLMEWRFSVV